MSPSALNPPCQPCDDSAVKLACLTVDDCEVISICNLERTFVLSAPAIRYWVPFLHALGEAPMQLFPQRLYTIGVVVALFQLPIATAVGAYLYKEG